MLQLETRPAGTKGPERRVPRYITVAVSSNVAIPRLVGGSENPRINKQSPVKSQSQECKRTWGGTSKTLSHSRTYPGRSSFSPHACTSGKQPIFRPVHNSLELPVPCFWDVISVPRHILARDVCSTPHARHFGNSMFPQRWIVDLISRAQFPRSQPVRTVSLVWRMHKSWLEPFHTGSYGITRFNIRSVC